MSVIKIHMEPEEHAVVSRFAAALHVKPEDVAYSALNRLMSKTADAALRVDIVETRDGRKHNLALWADSARSVHAYEGKGDTHQEEHLQF